MDITQLILDDHHEQRRRFAILEQMDPGDAGALRTVWARLAVFLEVHAAAEEKIFYPELLRAGLIAGRTGAAEAEEETLDAISDHNDIRDTIAAVAGHQPGTSGWFEAVAAVNVANGDHMAEEEREGLTNFRRHVGLQLRQELAQAFIAFEAANFAGVPVVDKDPGAYVRDTERKIAPGGADASLGIGSLRRTAG
jgi:Hemerythrin HHE cation binding domain